MAASQPRLIKFDSPVFAIAVAGGAAGELVLAAGGGGSARTGVLNQICSFGTPANATTPACLAKSSTDDKLVVQLAVSPDGALAAAVAERNVLIYHVLHPASPAAPAPAAVSAAVTEVLRFEAIPAAAEKPAEAAGGKPPPPPALNVVAWLPDGAHVVVGGTDGGVTVWRLSGCDWGAAAAAAATEGRAAAPAAACVRRLGGHPTEVTALAVGRLPPLAAQAKGAVSGAAAGAGGPPPPQAAPASSGTVLVASASRDSASVRVWELPAMGGQDAGPSDASASASSPAIVVRTPFHALPALGARLVGDRYAPVPKRGPQQPSAGPWLVRALAFSPPIAPGGGGAGAAGARPALFVLESSRSGAAVVSRWEWSKASRPPPAPSSSSSPALLLSTGHVYQLETPPAPAPRLLLALPPLGPPSSSPGLIKAPLAPLRLVAGGAAAAASAAAVSAAIAAAAPAPAPLLHRPLTIPQLGQTPALGLGSGAGAMGGLTRATLTVPQLGGGGGGVGGAAVPLKLSLPQPGGASGSSGTLKLSLPGAAAAGGAQQASPTRGTLLSLPLPLLGGSTQRAAAAAPPAPAPPPVASETAAPDRGGEWRCVQWAVVGRAPVPAMALSPDGGQLALGTSAGEVVLLAPATLAREWASRPIHGFPVTGVAFLGRTRCVVSGSADAHVAFTLLRPLRRRAPGSASCCGLVAQALAWLLLALFSLALSTGATAALSVAVARHPYIPAAAASDLPPLHQALSELDRLTAGQLAVLGRGIEDWAAEGRPRLLAEQVWAAVAGGGESVLQGVGDAAAAAAASVEYVRDGAGNMLRVYYPQGESRPHNEKKAAERERELADAASQASPADADTAPQSLTVAAGSVGPDDAESEAMAPPPSAEERERDAVAAAAAAARASLFDHSLNARAAAAAAATRHDLAGH